MDRSGAMWGVVLALALQVLLSVQPPEVAAPPHLGARSTARRLLSDPGEVQPPRGDGCCGTRAEWSCRDHPERCAAIFHVFTLPAAMRNETFSSNDLWMAWLAAASFRRAHGGRPPCRVVLVTNYAEPHVAALRAALSDGSRLQRDGKLAGRFAADSMEALVARAAGIDVAAASAVPWPFDDVRAFPSGTRYPLKAAFLVPRLETFDRVLFIDTDTVTQLPQVAALDALQLYDVAMVGEYKSMVGGSAYLYNRLLYDSTHNMPMWRVGQKVTSGTKLSWSVLAAYEQQYNTGLVAYRTTRCVRDLIERWVSLHESIARCKSDKVAWDQCSLPHALRVSRATVATLPEAMNFREALGNGCTGRLYDFARPASSGNASAAGMVHNSLKGAMLRVLVAVFGDGPQTLLRCNEPGGCRALQKRL